MITDNNLDMIKITSRSAHHNTFTLDLKDHPITITSDFDSGNLHHIQFIPPNTFIMTPANDCAGTEYEGHSKSWFYFKVTGLPVQFVAKFVIRSLHMLATPVSSINYRKVKFSEHYRAVYQCKGEPWRRTAKCLVVTKEQDTELQIEHRFQKDIETSFAFSYPHSYSQCQHFVNTIFKHMTPGKDVYFHNEIIIQSHQKRNINLLTISSQEGKQNIRESKLKDELFNHGNRANRFRSNKKVVLISARVHPGETPSSHTMNGIIKFLLSKDARAEVLRKYFVFMLIPMLNPDGVFHGHYRMDHFNQNLNRFYLDPKPEKQPGPFAVRTLAQYLSDDNRLFFYVDLHAHAGKKGNFFYGNALEDFNQQVETQLFAKLLSLNCVNFEYDNCNFSMRHMYSKDRNQSMTKEGCGRVVLQKLCNLTYSYTLECGYHQSTFLNELPVSVNGHRKIKKMGIISEDFDNIKSNLYAQGPPFFTIELYENVGRSLVITILDLFNKNPFSRIPNSGYKNLQAVRKDIADQVGKVDRFVNYMKALAYRGKKQMQQISTYVPVSDVFEREGVFQMLQRSSLNSTFKRRISNNGSVKPDKRIKNIRIRDYTHPKLFPRKYEQSLNN